MYSSRKVKTAEIKIRTAMFGVILAAVEETSLALWVRIMAPIAMPVLNIMNKPMKKPARGMNMRRQRGKLFRKMDWASVPLAVPSASVWFVLSVICFAS